MHTKMHAFLFFGLILAGFVSCTPPMTVIPTQSSSDNSSIIPTPLSTASSVPTKEQLLNFYYPKIEKRCPESREVPISRLGIDNSLRIILSNQEQTGLWNYFPGNPLPTLLQEVLLNQWTSNSISPSGERLAYTIWNQDHSLSIWLFSLTTNEHYEVLNINYWEGLSPYVRWLSSDELLLVNSCAGAGCNFPIKIINVNTGELLDVEKTDSGAYDTYLSFYKNSARYYALYSSYADDGYTRFYVYDYLSNQKIQIFPWLKDKIFFYPLIGTNLGLYDAGNKITMIVEQSYGFDVGIVDNSIEILTQITAYDLFMKRIVTEVAFNDLNFSSISIHRSNENLLLSMNYKDYRSTDNFTTDPQEVKDAFFTLNLAHPVIDRRINYLMFTNYCFTTTGYLFRDISPDGQIATFTSDKEIIFLDLRTGYIARLSNWRFIGWAM